MGATREAPQALKPFLLCLLARDPARAGRWARLLASQGWPIESARDVAGLAALAAGSRLGLGLADLELVGSAQLAELRRRAPHFWWVVVGTARDGAEAAACLESGAEDYIPAGLDERILAAKLRAHLRRLLPSGAQLLNLLTDAGGSLRLHRTDRRVDERPSRGKWAPLAQLTPTEARLMAFFLERPDMALERPDLLHGVWSERAGEVHSETLDRHVESLRRKLGAHGRRIETVYGVGYLFRGGADG